MAIQLGIQNKEAIAKNFQRGIKGIAATIGLLLVAGEPARAGRLTGTFSLFLECNNDGIVHQIDDNTQIGGWHYTHDAQGDNTDGFFYDILGMASKETEDEIVFVLSGNTPLTGTGYDRNARQVVWGDIFFSSGLDNTFGQTMNSGNLFGVRFADRNESGVRQTGVYSGVTAKSVAVNNFGHRTVEDYINLIDNDPNHQVKSDVANFLGDLDASDLTGDNPYLDVGTGYNTIAKGTKVQNDGFAMLGLDDILLNDFDLNQFAGEQTIAFKFDKKALQYQAPLREQAAELGVDWTWEDELTEFDTRNDAASSEIARLKNQEIKPLSNLNKGVRNSTPGHYAANDFKNTSKKRSNLKKKLTKANKVLKVLIEKKEKWDAMSPVEQASAAPEEVWTRKDGEDLAFQGQNTLQLAQEIADINTDARGTLKSKLQKQLNKHQKALNKLNKKQAQGNELTDVEVEKIEFYRAEIHNLQQHINDIKAGDVLAKLDKANKNYKAIIAQIREDRPDYVQREAELKLLNKELSAQKNIQKGIKNDKQNLEDEIRDIIAAKRKEVLEVAAAEQEQLETELGGPRTSASGGVPTTEAELEQILNPVPNNESIAYGETQPDTSISYGYNSDNTAQVNNGILFPDSSPIASGQPSSGDSSLGSANSEEVPEPFSVAGLGVIGFGWLKRKLQRQKTIAK
ncbi:MAG: hypothetical protein F6J93_18240 [Oscillatoria sp. SIO1A7]|nr:hypothetical protein [Oscillatoria sp. SIO1A7]